MSDSKSADHWVGFDLGGTKMLAVVYDGDFHDVGRQRTKTHSFLGPEVGIERVVETIQSALKQAGITVKQLGGIGVGCPGPLHLDEGVVLEAPNLGWKNVPIKTILEKKFDCPVIIANDVDLGVYGEYRFGAGRRARCLLGVFPGTGVGGGCIYQGEILRGRHGSCMEIGHVQVLPKGPRCGCGRRGCLEAVASRLAISAAAAQAVYRGQAPYLYDAAGTDLGNIRSGILAKSIEAGDTVIERIIKDAAGHIGVALSGAINLLAPDMVILGGGLVEAMPQIFVDSVTKAAEKGVMPSFIGTYKIEAAALGDDSTVMGAAAWGRHLKSAR